jgi:hypothetical protein
MKKFIVLAILLAVFLSGCSTRQIISELDGSTAQRLVTHSIDQLMQKIPAEDFPSCREKNVYVKPHFIKATPLLYYATERFKMELGQSFGCRIVESKQSSDYNVNLFFTSLGTESDIFGISIPFLVIPGVSGASDINILAVEMFHGISEMYYYVSNSDGQVLLRREKSKASVRTDKFALPFITIPINTMD